MLAELVAIVFPGRCPGCGAPGEPVCRRCAAGLRAPEPAPPPVGVDAWAAPFAYEGVAREVVARLKYRQVRAAVPWLATHMATAAVVVAVRVAAVTWVPTSPARRRARGFDHAELLARAVGRRLRLPVRRTLGRAPGPSQTELPAPARAMGPALHVVGRGVPARVLVVDDVATTGATLAAAARALRGAGSATVTAVTAARTPRNRAVDWHST